MFKFLFRKAIKTVCLTFHSWEIKTIRQKLKQGFTAIWNGTVWELTKTFYC